MLGFREAQIHCSRSGKAQSKMCKAKGGVPWLPNIQLPLENCTKELGIKVSKAYNKEPELEAPNSWNLDTTWLCEVGNGVGSTGWRWFWDQGHEELWFSSWAIVLRLGVVAWKHRGAFCRRIRCHGSVDKGLIHAPTVVSMKKDSPWFQTVYWSSWKICVYHLLRVNQTLNIFCRKESLGREAYCLTLSAST